MAYLSLRYVDAQTFLQLAKPEWIADMLALSNGFRSTQAALLKQPATLNPVFGGSRDIGGADADFIVDSCLVELKTFPRAEVTRDVLYQLLGYALLDYSDTYRLGAVGIYWARQQYFVRWELEYLLRDMTGRSGFDLSKLRSEFRATLASMADEIERKRAAKQVVL